MIITDPYCITLILTERIRRLMEAGHLAGLEPDRKYGYTYQIVFGVSIDDISSTTSPPPSGSIHRETSASDVPVATLTGSSALHPGAENTGQIVCYLTRTTRVLTTQFRRQP
jgi:hypothetical protein